MKPAIPIFVQQNQQVWHRIAMTDDQQKLATRPASALAQDLLPYLEAVANFHYLVDAHVERPDQLRQVREMEDRAFNEMLTHILLHVPNPLP